MTSTFRSRDYLRSLVNELCALPRESEWVEFKLNDYDPESIGEYISALSNSAALIGKAFAYLLWGVRNEDHEIIGTRFDPQKERVGNEELENWLLRLLEPKIDFRFFNVDMDGKPVVLLEIARATRHPVLFSGHEFIRVGSYKKKLKGFPEKERALWRIFDQIPFEDVVALERADSGEVLQLLDYPAFFDLLKQALPANRERILEALQADRLIRKNQAGGWDITNLGAILLAKKLEDFHTIQRKAVRVIQYRGIGRTETIKEKTGTRGYACGFEGLVGFINDLLPTNEVIEQALRKSVPMFPELAVRELIANALIHQDLFMSGVGPTVEIFDDRIEITNPGEPLVDTQRFVDTPPRSRNETLASLMRRFGICEERGSGIDKVVSEIELYQLPAPMFETPSGFTRAVLFSHKPLSAMSKADRVRACYLHACLNYVMRKPMTNASIRRRLNIDDKNIATASRILGEAVEAGLIVIEDAQVGTRIRRYLPYWAASTASDSEVV